jgi:hypothetical protein
MGQYECFFDIYTKSYRCSLLRPLKKKRYFSSYDDPAMIDSNPDNSAILKLIVEVLQT